MIKALKYKANMPPAKTHPFDEAILKVVSNRWQKVALVICVVTDEMDIPVEDGEKRLYDIADRIEALAHDGRLISKGDLKKWRFSEVRQPDNNVVSP